MAKKSAKSKLIVEATRSNNFTKHLLINARVNEFATKAIDMGYDGTWGMMVA